MQSEKPTEAEPHTPNFPRGMVEKGEQLWQITCDSREVRSPFYSSLDLLSQPAAFTTLNLLEPQTLDVVYDP